MAATEALFRPTYFQPHRDTGVPSHNRVGKEVYFTFKGAREKMHDRHQDSDRSTHLCAMTAHPAASSCQLLLEKNFPDDGFPSAFRA